jgi:PadR family transcriptional regulator PadR
MNPSPITADDAKALQREILLAFWKVHILHHAGEKPVVGQWMLLELRRHGYDVSPGTLYPILHRMEDLGWLRCNVDPDGGPRARRSYRLTGKGRRVLESAIRQLSELKSEVAEGRHSARHRIRPKPEGMN